MENINGKALFMVCSSLLMIVGLTAYDQRTVTVKFYAQNNIERIEKIAWCKDSLDRLEDINCKNAFYAEKRESK